jgi:hypothetical protein
MIHSIPDDSVILLENEFLIFEIVNLLHVKREMPVILHMKRDPNLLPVCRHFIQSPS